MADKVTKSEGDAGDFGAEDYAHVPDPASPSTWKLRLTATPGGDPDPGLVGAAAAALGPGYRGQKVDLPDEDRPGVVRKVRAAWKQVNPDKDETDMPDALQTNEAAVAGRVIRWLSERLGLSGRPAAVQLAELCAKGGSHALFVEALDRFAEPPDRMPVLPKPGRYQHPDYGTVEISRERNAGFVANFRNRVYQDHIPIDAEHDLKASGALGYLRGLIQNPDGSVDGVPEWNDRGRSLIAGDRFKYVSPEWYDRWTDPATGDSHRDVLIGAALTTRPFFKDKALRPLVASERGIEVGENPALAASPAGGGDRKEARMGDIMAPVGMTEEQSRQFADMQAKFAEMQATVAAERTARESAEATAKQAAERVTALERDGRRKRFTDLVTGHGDAGDGARWFGDIAANVTRLEKLADAWGEDSEDFRAHVTQQQAAAEALARSDLFREIGSGASAAGTTEEEVRSKAGELVKRGEFKEIGAAISAVMRADPMLARRYTDEQNRRGR